MRCNNNLQVVRTEAVDRSLVKKQKYVFEGHLRDARMGVKSVCWFSKNRKQAIMSKYSGERTFRPVV